MVNGRFEQQTDYFIGGNTFLYYNLEQLKNQDFRGPPDFFFLRGVPRFPMRKYWAVWEEGGRYPDAILELLSPSTAKIDKTVKKDIYERVFRTPEYFLFDPDAKSLVGYRLGQGQRYQPIDPDSQGRFWSEQLGGAFGLWTGKYQGNEATWVRLFDDHGELWATQEERAVKAMEELRRLQSGRK